MPRRATTPKKRRPAPPAPRPLRYKVVELANVDEASLELTVNQWVGAGWAFDGVQFAMRESSKRPSMAFVMFTRPGEAKAPLTRLVLEPTSAAARPPAAAWARLAQLADIAEEDEP